MTRRMGIAVLSLAGAFLATYLTFYKLGYIATLACGTGSCEVVQASRWSKLFGQPVALWGVGFYLTLFVLAVAGSFGRFADSRNVGRALVVLSGWGALFRHGSRTSRFGGCTQSAATAWAARGWWW